jgi:hypothetical protein
MQEAAAVLEGMQQAPVAGAQVSAPQTVPLPR